MIKVYKQPTNYNGPGKYCPEHDKKLDTYIKPYVIALRNAGFNTFASCQGEKLHQLEKTKTMGGYDSPTIRIWPNREFSVQDNGYQALPMDDIDKQIIFEVVQFAQLKNWQCHVGFDCDYWGVRIIDVVFKWKFVYDNSNPHQEGN